MRTITSAPKSEATISYSLTFAPPEWSEIAASAARAGLSKREWLFRAVRAALTPAVVAERALARTLTGETR